MQTKHSVIRQIITADFGCDECAKNDKCPIYRGERSSISLPRMPALPCLAYTYERAMLLLIDRMGRMTPTQALSLIGHKTHPQP